MFQELTCRKFYTSRICVTEDSDINYSQFILIWQITHTVKGASFLTKYVQSRKAGLFSIGTGDQSKTIILFQDAPVCFLLGVVVFLIRIQLSLVTIDETGCTKHRQVSQLA